MSSLGAMQDHDLRVSGLIDHAAQQHGGREIVTRWADGSETRTNWGEVRRDALRMTQALRKLGIGREDRIATLAMNHSRHLVSWYGATGVGGILHTINPRLFADQLEYIINHAEDRVLLYDRQFQPIVDRLKPLLNSVEHFICFDDAAPACGQSSFERWIGGEDGATEWEVGSERDPCMLCYTSGTTGNPKGVLYEHRSTVLHAMAGMQPAMFMIDARSVLFPIVPMYHAASWGLPWAGAACGAKFVYLQSNDPATMCDLMHTEQVTHGAGVPTVWLSVFQHIDATGAELPPLQHVITGGSACPRSTLKRLIAAGIRVAHVWGMTEMSPIGTVACEPAGWDMMTLDEQVSIKALQGRTPFGVEIRCVDLDDPSVVLPRDGVTGGALQTRGQWIIKRYFKADADAVGPDQWFDTGDVALIYPDGTLQITDRTKDVIKSGGEWISSVDLENAAVGHPAVAEAAAIGIAHPKWDERPLLAVVLKSGMTASADDIRTFLASRIARWWLPDAIEFVADIPHTGTGKISKKDLREQFRDYRFTD